MARSLQQTDPATALPAGHSLRNVNTSALLPVMIALLLLIGGGIYLLERADRQARDTTRKHHIEDIEQSLYFAYSLNGSFPPYNEATWCGVLNDPSNKDVLAQVEEALRAQHEKYANLDKPFPSDPRLAGQPGDYFYWKRSPASFELYSMLEETPTGERNTTDCDNSPPLEYDYSVASVWRQDPTGGKFSSSPL